MEVAVAREVTVTLAVVWLNALPAVQRVASTVGTVEMMALLEVAGSTLARVERGEATPPSCYFRRHCH